MREPKVKNKYNLKVSDIKRMEIIDPSKICEPVFWRNTVINAWCISGTIAMNESDRHFGNENWFWIGIYDKPYYGKRIHVSVTCWGGMGKYKFNEFYRLKDIENERDLITQEKLLEALNYLLDEKIVKLNKQK